MTNAIPVRETRDVLIQRAKDAMRLAEAEPIPNRARIHLAAAERWLTLADRKMTGRLKMRGGGTIGCDEHAPSEPATE
jgi:hypothetical protein